MLIFQFTLPREERRQVQAQPLTLQNFNPRSHERSDHFQRTLWRLLCHISIHAPTRGATSPGTTPLRWHWFQYTLPREERHITPEQWEQLKNFNTRSHERSDNGWWLSRGAGSNFNPRSHERSDNYIPDEFKSYIISIHAPTRGATMTSDETGMVAIFQSTLPREERHWWMAVWWRIFEFQSTLPREERPKWLVTLPPWLNFNPRSHERSDNIQNLTFALTKRFQSTLPREERHVLDIYIYDMCIFQSTLPREERRKKQSYNVRNRQFQSTLPREERRRCK